MVSPAVKTTEHFPFVGTKELRAHFNIGKFGEASLRSKLPRGIYWTKLDRKILWNFRLLQSFLLRGDCPDHQRLVEQFLQAAELSA